MASNFERYAYTKNAVLEKSSMLSTNYGRHIMNVVSDVDLENGCVVALGDFVEDEVWKAAAPTTDKAVLIIACEPKIYEEYTKRMQEESQFYVKAGEIAEADDMDRLDRITLSAEAFDADAVPAVGQYVGVKAGSYKLTTLGTSEPTGVAFVGYIYNVAANGNYRILVKRNMDV